MNVPFYQHNLQQEDKDELLDTLNGVFLTTGPKTRQFEANLAQYLDAKYCIGTTSWTTAAFLTLKAWGIGPGDEVIVPAMTFIATANIVVHCGAKPVFVDSEALTGNIDIGLIEKSITQHTKAIIPVHLYGQMVDLLSLSKLAKKHGLKVLEDCAHCIEGQRDGYRPGTHSDAACFSFYATKNITCGEGGAVVTNDESLTNQLRLLRLHGMSLSAADRYVKHYQHWDMLSLGYKANMSDIQASLLLNQLKRIDKTLERKESICQYYEKRFLQAGISFPKVVPNSVSARHLFTIWAPRRKRDEMLSRLQAAGIGVAVNFRAVPLLGYYVENEGYEPGTFPVAEEIGDRTITLPMYPTLTESQLDYIASTVISVYEQLREKKPSPPVEVTL